MKYLDLIDDAIGLDEIGDRQSIVDRLLVVKPENIIELAANIRDALPKPKKNKGNYRFVANTEMSALPYPCAGDECRIKAISGATLFAAMYADEMVFFNPFSYEDFFV